MLSNDNTSPLKVCSKCGEEKPLAEFYRNARAKDGLQFCCKTCHAAESRAYRLANPEKVATYARAYRDANRKKVAVRKRAYQIANPEIGIAASAAYRSANQETIAAQRRAYYAAHPERVSANSRNRRALKKAAEGTHTAEDIQAQYDRQKGRCYYCDILVHDEYHVDHVIPLSKGGSNGPDNLVISCPPCNRSKHNKHPMDWCGQLF